MRSDLRISGIDIIGDVPWGTHFCQFYQTKEELMDIIVPYFKAGFENNELCIWVISESLNLKEAKEVLKRSISDIDVYLEKGQIEIISCANLCLKEGNFNSQKILEGWIEKSNQALIEGYKGLRLTVDAFWQKDNLGNFDDYEERVNFLIGKYSVIALCTYSLEVCSSIDIIEIAAKHDFTLGKKKGKWEQIENSGQKNITKLKQTEQTFETEHARLRATLDAMPMAIWIADTDGRIVETNEQTNIIWGKPPHQPESMAEYSKYKGWRPDTGEKLRAEDWAMSRALTKGEVIVGEEVNIQRFDGSFGTILNNAAPIRDAEGCIIGGVVIEQDITAIKRTKKELQEANRTINESRERLQFILDNSPDSIFLQDSELRYVWISKPLAGLNTEQYLGRTDIELGDITGMPDSGRELHAIKRQILESGLGRRVEVTLDSPSGTKYFTNVYQPWRNDKGKIIGLAGYVHDITDIKSAQNAVETERARLQAIIENIPVAIGETGAGGGVMLDNGVLDSIWRGAQKINSVSDYREFKAWWPESGERVKPEDWPAARALQGEASTATFDIERFDGTKGAIIVSAKPLMGKSGEVASTIWTVQDITEVKQSKDALRAAYEKLQMQSEELQASYEELQVQSEELQAQTEELVEAYEALSESEERYRLLFDNSLDGIILTDPSDSGRILSANPSICRMLGWSEEELIGKGRDVRHVLFDSADPILSAVLEERAHSGSTKLQLTYRRRDGTKFIGEISTALFTDINGEPRAVNVIRDITERRQAEEALRKSEERYRMLFTNMTEALLLAEVIYNQEGKPCDYRFLDVNPAYEFNMGIKKEQVLGKSVLEVFPNASPISIENVAEVALSGSSIQFEVFSQPVNKHFEVYAFSPEKGRIATIFRDITEDKKAEEALLESQSRLETVFTAIPDAIIEYDVNGKPVRANEASLKTFGLCPSCLTRDKAVTKLKITHMDGNPVRVEELPTSRALKGEIIKGELYRFTDAQGKELVITTYAAPLFKDGNINGAVALWHDITELKRAEEELRQSENLYMSIARNLPNGAVYVFDLNLRLLAVEGEALERIGWSKKGLEGKSIYDLDEETRKIIEPRYRSVLAGQSLTFETSYRGRSILSQYVPIRNDKGEIFAGLVMGLDITERKAVEAELAYQRQLLQRIFDNIPVLLTIWNPRLEKFTLNPYAEKVLGWTTADANNGDFMTMVYPDPVYRAEVSSYMLSLEEGWREWIGTTKDGQHVPIGWANVFLTDDTMIGIGVDLRENKKVEAKIKETLDNLENLVKIRTAELENAYNLLKESERGLAEAQKMAHLGNWKWDIKTNELHLSDEVYRIFGYYPQEFNVTFDTYFNYIHPDDRNYVINAIKEAFKGKPYSIDNRIITASGEERIIHTDAEITFSEDNIPVYARGIVQDITERKKAEEILIKIDKIRIKEIHHRIKNNLQVISSLLDLQAEAFSNFEICKTSEVMEAFMESQNRVVSMALIHEELYKGDKIDNLNFAAYLRKLTADLFSSYNLGNNISLKLEFEQVDLGMDTAIPLGIIVNELVSNSFKHAFPAGRIGEIKIHLLKAENPDLPNGISGPDKDCTEKNGFDYMLKVSDNGKGISEGIDFQNVESLGLQLVNLLVEQIEGYVELKRDQGTEFIIWFDNIEE